MQGLYPSEFTFYANGMLTSILVELIVCHHSGIKDMAENVAVHFQMRAEVYACLWMLMIEEYVEGVIERQQLCISYWTRQLLRFIENTYRSRAGTNPVT